MSGKLERDLERWQDGRLGESELRSMHGDLAGSILGLHERLRRAESEVAPDPDEIWTRIDAAITPVAPVIRLRSPRRRIAAVAIAACLILGGTAFAAMRSVSDPPGPTVAPQQSSPHPPPTRSSHGHPSEALEEVTDPRPHHDGGDSAVGGDQQADGHDEDGAGSGSEGSQGQDEGGDDQGQDEGGDDQGQDEGTGGQDQGGDPDDGGDDAGSSDDGQGGGSGGDEQ